VLLLGVVDLHLIEGNLVSPLVMSKIDMPPVLTIITAVLRPVAPTAVPARVPDP